MHPSETSTPASARAHARAQRDSAQAREIQARPTVPIALAENVPADIPRDALVWDETLAAGGYASRAIERGGRIRLIDLEGDACVALLLYNADAPQERLNVADTIKVQWQAYLGAGAVLLSDMGRVLVSIVSDTSGHHDALCGTSNSGGNAQQYGDGDVFGPHPSGRDRLALGVAKHGLSRRDVCPNVNLFKRVAVGADGSLHLDTRGSLAGAHVELRAEMRTLIVLANVPHVLDPRTEYVATPVRVLGWRGPVAGPSDPVRASSPERTRAFENVDDYYSR